ncbi:MAG: SDR family oxidoreductase [Halobacteriota archaeon]
MDETLEGRVALLTGASSGIGKATAREFAKEGATVALAARGADQLETLVAELELTFDVPALGVPTDVRDEAAVESMVEETIDRFGRLDVVVNNAGVGTHGPVATTETEEYRRMMDTNVDGMFFTTRAVLPHLVETEGNLVFLGSFAGQYPRPSNPIYAATKWWTRGFALSLEGQVGSDGVGITVVNPTEVRTEFGSEAGASAAERFGPEESSEPEEVADAIVFAAKQRHSTISEIDLYRRDKLSDW